MYNNNRTFISDVVGVRLKTAEGICYFLSNGINLRIGYPVIVETPNGLEFGTVVTPIKKSDVKFVKLPPKENFIRKVQRIANQNDMNLEEQNRRIEQDAFEICTQKIRSLNLKMDLVDVLCIFSNTKLLFLFTSDTRIDFRELVRDLASTFKTRIELRQIGVRDKAKKLGGLGACGREFCCKSFQGNFNSVSIKMAKEQGLSLNPVKISGTCGRLMCCLEYEYAAYRELYKITPKQGSVVSFTQDGQPDTGVITDVNLITGKLKVTPSLNKDVPITIDKTEVKVIREPKEKHSKDENALKDLE